MSEFPPRSCGKCAHKGTYEKIAEKQGDYLYANTIPKPELAFKEKSNLNDKKLGVPRTNNPPNLEVPVINTSMPQPSNLVNLPPITKKHSECCCKTDERKSYEERCGKNPYEQIVIVDESLNIPHPKMEMNLNTTKNVGQVGKMPEQKISDVPKKIVSTAPPKPEPFKGILKKRAPCVCEKAAKTPPPAPKKADQKETVLPIGTTNKTEEKTINRECYFPRPEDDFPDMREDEMGVLGPWATGRLDWGPLAGLTGIRPIVDKYSVARFSEGEWRTHNKKLIDEICNVQHQSNLLEYNSKEGIEQTRASTDKNQADSTRRLHQREQELHRWKCELERSISASAEEISMVQEQRRRLKQSMAVLQLPEAIAGECLERRTGRADSELVRDEVEEELIKELALTAEVKEQFTRTLADVEHQLVENKTAKQRLEYDWSDKKLANEIECTNVALNDHSNILLFKPGAVGFPDHQSTREHWEKFTRETLEESEITRQRSVALRGTLDAILTNASRDLRAQADRVNMALARRVACTEEIRTRLENELLTVLRRLADIESTVSNLKTMVRRMDTPLKKAQTRLDNRLMYRPRVENCRDDAQYGLVDEAKTISENVAALVSQLSQAEDIQSALMTARGSLEREIMVKRKTLEIDRDRAQLIRSHYPSATAMAGY